MKATARLRLLALSLAACACAAAAQAQTPAAARHTKDEAAVLAADRAWADAAARGDVAALEKLFADEYVIVGNSGRARNKREEIADLAPAADVKTYYFRTEEVEARAYGCAAVVRGRAVWKVNYKGREIDNNRRYTSTYVKRGGRWLLVAQQISANIQPATQ